MSYIYSMAIDIKIENRYCVILSIKTFYSLQYIDYFQNKQSRN